MQLKSVLIIDDDEDIRDTISQALELEGYTVHSAIHGQDGLKVLESLAAADYPGMIILDLMMPVMDGSQFLEFVHANKKDTFAKIPIILASAKGNHGDHQHAKLASEILKKPLDLDELYAVVKKYCYL